MLMMLFGIVGAVMSGVVTVILALAIGAILRWRKASDEAFGALFVGTLVLLIIVVQIGFVGGAIEGWRRTDWSKPGPVPATEADAVQ